MKRVLECKDISKTYGNDKIKVQALKKCSLSFGQGEFVAIVGKSGSGKSTLLKILGTLDAPDEGEVLLDGEISCICPIKNSRRSGAGKSVLFTRITACFRNIRHTKIL